MNLNFSSVDWGPVAGQLMKIGAPLVGTIIGGPVGGVAGSVIGALAGMLGTDPTPEAISAGLQTPEGQAAAVNFEADNKAKLEAAIEQTKQVQIEQTNLSLRAEVATGDKFQRYARPFNMYMVGAVTGSYGFVIVIAAIQALLSKQFDGLRIVMEAGPALGIALTPAGAVAGVTAWQTSKEKIAGVPQRPAPSLLVPGKKK